MKTKLQTPAIFFLILSLAILSCSPLSEALGTPAEPDTVPIATGTESSNAEPQLSDIISSDNAKNLVEISSWGKGSGHLPTYSPDGGLVAVSSSSGIYLYDAHTLEEKMYFAQRDVLDMAFSTDGKALSTVVDDYQVADDPNLEIFALVQQWDVASGDLLHSASLVTGEPFWNHVVGVFSADGLTLATGFDDNAEETTVRLWDVVSGQELHSFGISYFSGRMAFSPDNDALAVGDYQGVSLWDVSTGNQVRTLYTGPADPSGIWSLVFSPDGRRLAVAYLYSAFQTEDNTTMWDVAGGSELFRFHTPLVYQMSSTVFSMAFSPDGTLLATGSSDSIKFWDSSSGSEVLSISASNVESLSFSPAGTALVTASSLGDDSVKFWDLPAGGLRATLKGDDIGRELFWSPDSTTLAAIDGYTVRLRDVYNGEIRILGGHPGYVQSIAFSPDGTLLVSASDWNPAAPPTNLLKLWDVASGRELHTLDGHTSAVSGVAFSLDGGMLASVSWDETIKLWDVATGSELRTLSGNTGLGYDVAFSPDGTLLASAFNDDTGDVVKLWDVTIGSELRTLSVNTDMGLSVAFSPDGKVLVSSYYFGYGLKQLWDVVSGEEILTFSEDTDTERSFTLSSDGETLATSFEGGIVKLWDMTSRQELHTLSCDSKAVRGLDFSPDGTLLASGCGEDIRLWDVASGQELASLSVGDVYSLSFSPDGKLILVRSFRGMSLWGVSP